MSAAEDAPGEVERPLMHDPVNMLLADTYARRHGFADFLDARPLELLVIIVDDVVAIRAALDEADYVIVRTDKGEVKP